MRPAEATLHIKEVVVSLSLCTGKSAWLTAAGRAAEMQHKAGNTFLAHQGHAVLPNAVRWPPPAVCRCHGSRRGTTEPTGSRNCWPTHHVEAVDGLPCLYLMEADVAGVPV